MIAQVTQTEAKRPKLVRQCVTHPVTGERKWISAPTRDELAARVDAMRRIGRDMKAGAVSVQDARRTATQIVSSRMKLQEAWQGYLRTVTKVRTERLARTDWAQRLAPWFGELTIHDLDAARMQAWEQDLVTRGYADGTIVNTYYRLVSVYRWLETGRRVTGLPWDPWRMKTKIPKPGKRPLKREACRNVEEFLALVQAAQRYDETWWKRGAYQDLACRVVVGGLCGLRQGELGGLGWDHVNLGDPPVLYIEWQCTDEWRAHNPGRDRPMDPPKNGIRKVMMHPAVLAFLLQHREQLRSRGWYRHDGPVFPGKAGQWRTHADCIRQSVFKQIAVDAGLPNPEKWSPHSLKHSFATLELASGGDLRTTQTRTGHSSIEMLENYLHAMDRGLPRSAIPELNLLPGAPSHVPAPELPIVSRMLVQQASNRLEAAEAIQRTRDAALQCERRERKRRAKQGRRTVFGMAELAADHVRQVAAGRQALSHRPEQVTVYADASYSRAYSTEMRSTGDVERAKTRGKMSRRAVLASWGRIVKDTMRTLSESGELGGAEQQQGRLPKSE